MPKDGLPLQPRVGVQFSLSELLTRYLNTILNSYGPYERIDDFLACAQISSIRFGDTKSVGCRFCERPGGVRVTRSTGLGSLCKKVKGSHELHHNVWWRRIGGQVVEKIRKPRILVVCAQDVGSSGQRIPHGWIAPPDLLARRICRCEQRR